MQARRRILLRSMRARAKEYTGKDKDKDKDKDTAGLIRR
jgi:hypothetical protein